MRPLTFWLLASLTLAACSPADPIATAVNSSDEPNAPRGNMQMPSADATSSAATADGNSQDLAVPLTDTGAGGSQDMFVSDAGVGDSNASDSNEPSLSVAEGLAAELEDLCAADCAKDAMCNPETAEPVDSCATTYCQYLESLDATALSAELIDCFAAERDLFVCINSLTCEQYTAYYYGDGTTPITTCSDEETAYDAECSAFFQDEAASSMP